MSTRNPVVSTGVSGSQFSQDASIVGPQEKTTGPSRALPIGFQRPPTKLELVSTWLLQIFSVIFALLFGVFTALAYFASNNANTTTNVYSAQANSLAQQATDASNEANRLTSLANQLSLVALCSSLNGNISGSTSSCDVVLSPAYIDSLASQVLVSVSIPATTASPSTSAAGATSTSASSTALSTGAPSSAVPSSSSISSAIPTNSATSVPVGTGGNGLSPPEIGIIIGVILAIFAVVVVIFVSLRLRQRIRNLGPGN